MKKRLPSSASANTNPNSGSECCKVSVTVFLAKWWHGARRLRASLGSFHVETQSAASSPIQCGLSSIQTSGKIPRASANARLAWRPVNTTWIRWRLHVR